MNEIVFKFTNIKKKKIEKMLNLEKFTKSRRTLAIVLARPELVGLPHMEFFVGQGLLFKIQLIGTSEKVVGARVGPIMQRLLSYIVLIVSQETCARCRGQGRVYPI